MEISIFKENENTKTMMKILFRKTLDIPSRGCELTSSPSVENADNARETEARKINWEDEK